MKLLVEFCINNFPLGTEKVKHQLEGDHDYEVLEYDCLGYCQQCMNGPFALVEGELIEAKSSDELIMKIKERLLKK